ncbi:glycosyl hydrolase [Streptomyces longispororuber]|uniref:glycoside hydrolase family 26 protein n=1 Tax=Streptomyces longispororuber TaxID=68230 RepID=UPI0033C3A045
MTPYSRRRAKHAAFVAGGIIMASVVTSGPGYTVDRGRESAARHLSPMGPVARAPAQPSPPAAPPGAGPAASGAPAAPEASGTPGTPAEPDAPAAPVVPPAPQVPKAPTDSEASPAWPAFGAYLDYGPRGVSRMAELSRWLGGAELRVGHTYLPGDRWSNIAGAPRFLESWAEWRRQRDDRLFVLNVPMLERNEDGVEDAVVRAELRRGAAGEFDEHYRTLARRLVGLGVPDTVIVLGWEMNGVTYTHRCGPAPKAWKTYWRRIVTVMREVPGQKFRFDFTPSRGRDAIPWTRCYPGDDVVDIIGMDSYDQPEGISFDEQVSEPYGLQFHADFAAKHEKPISFPEWGLFRNGDNPTYMRRMLAWMDEKKPLYNTLTDYCPHGVWQCASNPESAAVYRALLTGRGEGSGPRPAEPPRPSQPSQPAKCAPLELGDWVEYWLGGKLCLRFDWWREDGGTGDGARGDRAGR